MCIIVVVDPAVVSPENQTIRKKTDSPWGGFLFAVVHGCDTITRELSRTQFGDRTWQGVVAAVLDAIIVVPEEQAFACYVEHDDEHERQELHLLSL